MSKTFNFDSLKTISRRSVKYIDKIILHDSHSDFKKDDNIDAIKNKHLEKGFYDIGYHFFVDSIGNVFVGRSISLIGKHCNIENFSSIGICLSGKEIFSDIQINSTVKLIKKLCSAYDIKLDKIFGHKHFEKNNCPNFDIKIILEKLKNDEDEIG